MKMKTKSKPVSAYQKTQVRMKQESVRALAHVQLLKNLYREMMEEKKKETK
jgi:hypothetical protein